MDGRPSRCHVVLNGALVAGMQKELPGAIASDSRYALFFEILWLHHIGSSGVKQGLQADETKNPVVDMAAVAPNTCTFLSVKCPTQEQ